MMTRRPCVEKLLAGNKGESESVQPKNLVKKRKKLEAISKKNKIQ